MPIVNGIVCWNFGIGDLVILKHYCVTQNIKLNLIIFDNNLLKYRLDPHKYLIFVKNLISNLFDKCKIEISSTIKLNPNDYKIFRHSYKLENLYNYYSFKFKYSNCLIDKNSPYIIFHTKARLSTQKCVNYYLSQQNNLINFFSNFKSKYKIILMGERYIEQNYEAILLNMQSVYNILINLNKNNEILDLTSDLISSSNDINNFNNELHIIHNAHYNITFGEGGNMVICHAFCDNNLSYLGIEAFQDLICNEYEKKSFRDLNVFLDTLKEKFTI